MTADEFYTKLADRYNQLSTSVQIDTSKWDSPKKYRIHQTLQMYRRQLTDNYLTAIDPNENWPRNNIYQIIYTPVSAKQISEIGNDYYILVKLKIGSRCIGYVYQHAIYMDSNIMSIDSLTLFPGDTALRLSKCPKSAKYISRKQMRKIADNTINWTLDMDMS